MTKKAFEDVKPIVRLRSQERADYIHDRLYHEVRAGGGLCWGGSSTSTRAICPGEVATIDFFRVAVAKGRHDLDHARPQIPSSMGWEEPRTFIVKRNGDPLEPKAAMALDCLDLSVQEQEGL